MNSNGMSIIMKDWGLLCECNWNIVLRETQEWPPPFPILISYMCLLFETKQKKNKTFTYCPPSFGVDPAYFYALAMSDFWARMPPFRDSIFLPSVRLLGSLRSECLFLGYACFSLVSLLVVGSVVGRLVVDRQVNKQTNKQTCLGNKQTNKRVC